MISKGIKIILLILAVLPIWWTLIAFAEVPSEDKLEESWKNYLNSFLLEKENIRVQITEIQSTRELASLDMALMKKTPRIDLVNINARGTSRMALKYIDSEGRLKSITYLSVKLYVQRYVPVASRELTRGAKIMDGDINWQWMDASELPRDVVKGEEVIGRYTRSTIYPNHVISRSRLAEPTLISRGERVKIRVSGQGINVTTMGVAQEGGSRGETIRILNPESKKEIYAVVVGAQIAEVRL